MLYLVTLVGTIKDEVKDIYNVIIPADNETQAEDKANEYIGEYGGYDLTYDVYSCCKLEEVPRI